MNNLPADIMLIKDETVLTDSKFKEDFINWINDIILNDFDKLISLLYRIDVSEIKLKTMLAENSKEDASKIIASLIIERQLQKIKSRAVFKSSNDSSEERW